MSTSAEKGGKATREKTRWIGNWKKKLEVEEGEDQISWDCGNKRELGPGLVVEKEKKEGI